MKSPQNKSYSMIKEQLAITCDHDKKLLAHEVVVK
jgi:hypothetical protein